MIITVTTIWKVFTLLALIYPSCIHSECNCTKKILYKKTDGTEVSGKAIDAIPEHFAMDDMAQCFKTPNCKWEPQYEMDGFLNSFERPRIHNIVPNHCAYTAAWTVTENRGIETGWNEQIWNERAKQIDDLFQKFKKSGYKTMRENTGKHGAFTPGMVQLMLQTVGLNFGVVTSSALSYPSFYKPELFTVQRETCNDGDLEKKYFKQMLEGKMKFMNSQRNKKPMVSLLLSQSDSPRVTEAKPDHMVAVVKGIRKHPTKGDIYFYVDSNVHEVKHLISGKSPPLTNVYKFNDRPVQIYNGPEKIKKKNKKYSGFKNGYAVDYSLVLGEDIDTVAQWLEDKMLRRPQFYEKPKKMITEQEQLNPNNAGGGIDLWVVVEDKKIPWKDMLKSFKEMKEKGTYPGDKSSAKIAHAGFTEYNWILFLYEMDLALIVVVFLILACMAGAVFGFLCNFAMKKEINM